MFLHYTTYPNNEDPFNKRQTKSRNGPVSSCSWSSQTERQEKSNPVEEECHWESRRKPAGQALFIFQGQNNIKTLHTGFSLCYINISVKITLSYFGWLPEKILSSTMYLLKKVSMKMPSFPILSWSVSSKSSRVTKSSSCKSKGEKTWVNLSQSSPYSNPNSACGSSTKGQQTV